MSSSTYPDNMFRYCPVCGASGFTVDGGFAPGPEGRHAFTCPACGFRFYINASIGTAAFMVNERKDLLMMRRLREPNRGTLDLPGGFAAPGEPSEAALRREVREEVNLELDSLHPWQRTYCNEYEYGGITYFTTDTIYLARVHDWHALRMNDPDEAEPVLVPLDEVNTEDIGLTSIREAAADILTWLRERPERLAAYWNVH